MTDEIYETPATTPDFKNELAAQLAELMPEAIADGKVDVGKIKELLDDDAADENERFGLFWPGKKRALRAAQEPTTATLRPDFENSKDWDTTKNVFIEGDNLEVLKILQKHYHGKIKMIYIDPPYNTGGDFVYPDNFREGLDTYLSWTKQVNEEGKKVSTNSDTDGRFHSSWLNMIYPRLKLARNLLCDDGVIFASIDYNENYNLRSVMNEVFGETNFIGEIYWESKTKSQNTSTAYNKLQPKVETILVYTKRDLRRFNLMVTGAKSYPFTDDVGSYRIASVEQMDKEGIRGRESMVFSILGIMPRAGKQWQIGKDSISAYAARGDLLLVEGRPSIKIRPRDERSEVTQPFWGFFPKDIGTAESAKKELKDLMGSHGFDTVKPVELLKRLVFHATNDGDIVLDFFGGSGTSGHAVMEQNLLDNKKRRFILVQLPEPTAEGSVAHSAGYNTVADLLRSRLRAASTKLKGQLMSQDLDTGFRSYVLSDTSFSKWRASSEVDRTTLEEHLFDLRESSTGSESTADNLLTEILLKQGYSLTEQIETVEIDGLELRSIGSGTVLAYLDSQVKPTLEQLRAVVDADPQRLIVLEDSFQGDDELKTNLAQLVKSRGRGKDTDMKLWTA